MSHQYISQQQQQQKQKQKQQFHLIYDFILPAKILFKISDREYFKCFEQNSEQKIYFKCIQVPPPDENEDYSKKSSLMSFIEELNNEITISQKEISSFVLTYQSLVVKYPYICVFHNPITTNLRNFLEKEISYREKIDLMILISKAVEDLHNQQLCLNILKPDNIIIIKSESNDYSIAFSDLKCMRLNRSKQPFGGQIRDKSVYIAPQFADKAQYSLQCDIWSLGIIFYQILFNTTPVVNKKFNHISEYQNILNFPKACPQWIVKFITKMASIQRKDRYKIKDVINLLKKAQVCSQSASKFYSFGNVDEVIAKNYKMARKYTL